MKKLKIALCFLILSFSASKIQAQHDFQVNLSNAILYELDMQYEYIVNDNFTIGAFGGYVYGFPGAESNNKYLSFGPEARFYVFPEKGADRFYIGVYARYKNGFLTDEVTDYGRQDGQNVILNYLADTDYTKFCIGTTMGLKWRTSNNVLVGFYGGLGRIMSSDYDNIQLKNTKNFERTSYSVNENNMNSEYFDFRIGVNIGYHF